MPIPLAPCCLILSIVLAACDADQATTRPAIEPAQARSADVATDHAEVVVEDAGHGPDEDAVELAPGVFHGNWRLAAADDPHDQALMAFTVLSAIGETEGSGDFVLFQPFCDAVANAPIRGDTECELIDLGDSFAHVLTSAEAVELVFHPTADGFAHRLRLRREGDHLAGDYTVDGDHVRRAVVARIRPD